MPEQLADRVISIDIEAPIQKVWDEITKTGKIQRALYNTVLESDLRPGAKLRYYSPNKKRVFVVGEVREVEPPHRLAHTYMNTMHEDIPTLVTWELEPTAEGTKVTIVHSGWTSEHTTYDKTYQGWDEILGLLKSELETGTIPFKMRAIYAMMNLSMFMLPKKTSVDYADKRGW